MQLARSASIVLALFLVAGFVSGQEPTGAESKPPIPLDKVEQEEVRLIILDTLVVDSKDRTVPGLTKDDFEIVTRGKAIAPDTLDVKCDTSLPAPRAVNHVQNREAPAPEGAGGRVVFAFDYLHLRGVHRARMLDWAQEMVQHGRVEGEEIMVVALNGGLRIEQIFTDDRDQAMRSLQRMQHDITLWQPSFFHQNEFGWVRGITALLDVLGEVPGRKAILLFSEMKDVPLDLQFQELAAQASATRCSIYPIDGRGLPSVSSSALPQRVVEPVRGADARGGG